MASEKIDALELDVNAKVTTENLDKLVTALGRLSKALDKVNAKQVNDGIKETGDSAKVAAEKANILTKSFADQAVKITALIALYRKLGNVISDGIENSMSYVENLNLFTVSMGEYAASAEKYGNTVKEALGIDPSNWIRTQGVFNTLIKGFGVGGDQAAYMSQNLTQLSYDIASFYNLSVAEAEQKLQSAVAGELEPVRRLGYDLSQSKLTEIAQDPRYYGRTTYAVNQETGALEANSEAINTNTQRTIANFNELTQGEKVQLRYIALMTQVTQAQGDMARTLNDPANQMRIFKEQLNQTSRALGNIFIPALNQVMPYITAFCQLIIGLAVHYTDKTATSLAKQIDIKVTDSVALTVEIAIEGSILATNLCKKWSDGSACFYVSLVVFSQVDVGCQLRTGIQMLRSIVAPPQELLRSTNFVPSINGSHIVLLYCSAVFADTHFVEFVRIENGVTCRSILIYSTHRCAITRVACSISINKSSFFLDRQRSWVNTYPLIEALNTALLSIQEIGKFATLNGIFIL